MKVDFRPEVFTTVMVGEVFRWEADTNPRFLERKGSNETVFLPIEYQRLVCLSIDGMTSFSCENLNYESQLVKNFYMEIAKSLERLASVGNELYGGK